MHLNLEERPGWRYKLKGGVISMRMVIQGMGMNKVTWVEFMGQRSRGRRARPRGRDRRAEKLPAEREKKEHEDRMVSWNLRGFGALRKRKFRQCQNVQKT